MPRIIDKINSIRKEEQKGKIKKAEQNKNDDQNQDCPYDSSSSFSYYSLEFFPPKTEAGFDNLLTRIERMCQKIDPLFVDITWGAGGSTAARTLSLSGYTQRYLGVDVLMHLTCTQMTTTRIKSILDQAKTCGVQNILALRGDPPQGVHRPTSDKESVSILSKVGNSQRKQQKQGEDEDVPLKRAIDLVKLIRELHGDYFCIGVAGHPEGHPFSTSQEQELKHLKEKIDAGADFIVTQFFYDVDIFLDYVRNCRKAGITCPIIPGLMPIQSYSSFLRMTEFCNIKVPTHITNQLEPIRDNDESVKEVGCQITAKICKQISCSDVGHDIDGIHFYTLNLERSTFRILDEMNALSSSPEVSSSTSTKEKPNSPMSKQRQFPWKSSALEKRSVQEEVRPINWANRPKSYAMRTDDWDEYPNGRWGDSTSPAFGELSSLSHFYRANIGTEDERRQYLGEYLIKHEDVYNVFARYIEGSIPYLPWCESSLQPESFTIQSQLATLNRNGFLTINSQPATNGVNSEHPVFGWGRPDGYVYQKLYLECFVSPNKIQQVVEMVKENTSMHLYAVNHSGEEIRTGSEENTVTALTWGVFPNREIIQPTIFEPSTFLVWAEEAFLLWDSMWASLYDYGSQSFDLIDEIKNTYFLVAIIDNDFIGCSKKDGEKFFDKLLDLTDK